MSRKVKNIIMTTIIIIVCIASGFTIKLAKESGEYSSTTSNGNAIIATGDVDVNLSNITVDKTGDSDGGDSSNFYGNNSAILSKNGANLTINTSGTSSATIRSDRMDINYM